MSAIKLSTSALRPIAARRIVPAATARTTAPAFTQIRSVSSNGDELGGVKGSEPATKPNRYNVRAGTITVVGVVVALGYMFYRKGDKKGTAPLGASQ
ncbi:uncharacterized protein B0T23DRAFT_135630 [Neurospora hispaniola]|uniref:Uncharacterized protein n=1 Tax=Neurospora hispaniola TaxID=588809 RepID=A0AAJ0I789_9PEZI|nr:hypothetical protein B0T23DRAFT_135630 [Neurospora hispaniola]